MKTHAPVESSVPPTQEFRVICPDRGRFQNHHFIICLILAIVALMAPSSSLHAANSSGECYVTVNVSGGTLPAGWSYQLQYYDTDSNWYNGASGSGTQTYYKQQGDWANKSIQWRCQLKNNSANYGTAQTNICYAGSDSVSFTVAAPVADMPPTITGQPTSQSVSAGASVTLTVTATGTAPLGYQWRKNGGNISGATSASYTIASVATGDAGNYSCIVSNTVGIATSQDAVLTVFETTPDSGNGSWAMTGPMYETRSAHTATLLPNGKVLVAGGRYTNTAELYNPATRHWETTAPMASSRASHTATLLTNGKVLVMGGLAGSPTQYTASAELYDPDTQTWSTVESMNVARAYHSAGLMQSGKVLVAGGLSVGSNHLASAEVFDPVSGHWSLVDSMATPRAVSMMASLPNGEVLINGGRDGSDMVNGYLSSSEIYSPSVGTWRSTGPMNDSRAYSPSAVLPNGNVLAIGWHVNNYAIVATAEQYDPSTGNWLAVGSMHQPRYGHSATTLTDGRVVVAGGYADGPSFSTAESYNPQTSVWATLPSMNTARVDHTATLLPNGSVLVAGGSSNASAETYSSGLTLTLEASVHGSIAATDGPFTYGSTAIVTATPSPGYVLQWWTGDASGTSNPLTLTMSADMTIGAKFSPDLTDDDHDGLSAYAEIVIYGTNPDLADSDGDGFSDSFEINTGFDPKLATSTPDAQSSIRTAVEFRFNAASGVSYRIEDSTDLQNWNTVEAAIVGEGGVVTRFYSTENLPKRYFRVRRN